MPRIPLIEDLVTGSIPSGSNILVIYDATSQWQNLFATIAVGWLRGGGKIRYILCAEPPEKIRLRISRLGLNYTDFEANERLLIMDAYTATLGLKSKEAHMIPSWKVSDLSVGFVADLKNPEQMPDSSRIIDDEGIAARFNEDTTWVEYVLPRVVPQARATKLTQLIGLPLGVHSDWIYKRLENAHDGVLDMKIEERNGEIRNLLRIRIMRDLDFDSQWHEVVADEKTGLRLSL